jgi:hypothetical protein
MAPGSVQQRWLQYYTRKRILHQWTQLAMLGRTDAERVLEVGPHLGAVTAMLANSGYQVTTLDYQPPAFASPQVPHLECNLQALKPDAITGFDAILCCETLEHVDWDAVPSILACFHGSGARHLVVSVPYMAFQITLDLYVNRYQLHEYFTMKKLLFLKQFKREPEFGHQWEVGYKGYGLERWEAVLKAAGYRITSREFTAHCRSVFHLLERV